jgi:hypothetical protein
MEEKLIVSINIKREKGEVGERITLFKDAVIAAIVWCWC